MDTDATHPRPRFLRTSPSLTGGVALLILTPIDFVLYGFGTLATDPCGPDACPAGVTVPLAAAQPLYGAGVALVLLSAVLSWWPRMRFVRGVLSAAGVVSAAAVVPLLLTIPHML